MSDQRLKMLKEFAANEPDDAFAHYGVALELSNAGQHAEAVDWFNKTIDIDARYSAAYYQLSLCYQKMGESEKFAESVKSGHSKMVEIGDNKMKFEFERLAGTTGVKL